jgi:hypothetical protein
MSMSISLVTHGASKAGAEIFNNYGAKPNSELLLGYGFTLRANPDDTIVLKVGGRGAGASVSGAAGQQQHEVGRGARGAESVWGTVLDAVKTAARARDEEGDPTRLGGGAGVADRFGGCRRAARDDGVTAGALAGGA